MPVMQMYAGSMLSENFTGGGEMKFEYFQLDSGMIFTTEVASIHKGKAQDFGLWVGFEAGIVVSGV